PPAIHLRRLSSRQNGKHPRQTTCFRRCRQWYSSACRHHKPPNLDGEPRLRRRVLRIFQWPQLPVWRRVLPACPKRAARLPPTKEVATFSPPLHDLIALPFRPASAIAPSRSIKPSHRDMRLSRFRPSRG